MNFVGLLKRHDCSWSFPQDLGLDQKFKSFNFSVSEKVCFQFVSQRFYRVKLLDLSMIAAGHNLAKT